MRTIISVFLFLMGLNAFAQEGINFETAAFKDILAKAKKENKLVFLDAYASWCGPCKMMEKNVFVKEDVKKFYNSNFINAHFDMEKGEGREIAAKYGVYSYPTFLFLNGDGAVVFKSLGYQEEKAFLNLGNQAKMMGEGGTGKERFEKGETDPDFLLNTMKLNANTDPEFAKKVSERYFKVRKKKDFSQDELTMLFYFLRSENDPNYQVFINEKAEILKLIPEETYNQFLNQIKLNSIAEKSVNQKDKLINDDYFMREATKLMSTEDAGNYLKILKINAYRAMENWPEYQKTVMHYYRDGEGIDVKELNMASFLFAEKINDKNALKQAVIWMEKSLKQGSNVDNNFILAKLYFKLGEQSNAKKYVQESIKLAKERGMDASVQEKFLSEIK